MRALDQLHRDASGGPSASPSRRHKPRVVLVANDFPERVVAKALDDGQSTFKEL